jgi:hypothetical protein
MKDTQKQASIADRQEILELVTAIMRSQYTDTSDRLTAAELLLKWAR